MMEELYQLMQHDGNRGDAHPMLQNKAQRGCRSFSHLRASEVSAAAVRWPGAATYADREDGADLVHGVAVGSHADVGVLRFGVFHVEFCGYVLNERLHSPGAASNAHKLGEQGEGRSLIPSECRCPAHPPARHDLTVTLTSPNIAGRLWVLVPRLKWYRTSSASAPRCGLFTDTGLRGSEGFHV